MTPKAIQKITVKTIKKFKIHMTQISAHVGFMDQIEVLFSYLKTVKKFQRFCELFRCQALLMS